jgi:hypothetical protein
LKIKNCPDYLCASCATYFWKAFDEGYNFALNLTSIWGFNKKLRSSKVVKVLIWESWDKMTFGCRPHGQAQSPSRDESYESVYAHGLSVHQKCSNHALINLLFGLCRFMWIINIFVPHLSPHPKALAHPFTLEVLWTREHTPTPFFVVFNFGFAFKSFKECGGAPLNESLCVSILYLALMHCHVFMFLSLFSSFMFKLPLQL